MPERPPPGGAATDPELERALARLRLGDLPAPLHDAVATALAWAQALDRPERTRTGSSGRRVRRPR